jgi:beta-N-acetylhexosaminidase
MNLREKIGQMLVVGFPDGEAGLAQLERVLEKTKAGNIILFSRNIGSAKEVYDLVSELDRLVLRETSSLPLVCLDQEGGVVARLRQGVTALPGSMAIGAAYRAGLISLAEVRGLGRICGSELAALGINWNLAPVVDVNVNPRNPLIGVRSYGEEPELVADLASAFSAGLAKGGVLATAKHFPGHGDTEVDSHLGLPLVAHGRERLDAVELLPFRRLIKEGIPVIMTAHVRFPAVEPDALPATLSPRVIKGLLRGELGYKGLVCTDCLEMKAIAGRYEEAGARAVMAGADFILVSHTEEAQMEAAESIYRAVERGDIPESRIDESLARIASVKAGLKPRPSWEEARGRLELPESMALATHVSRSSLSLYPGSPFPEAEGSLYVDVEAENLTGVEDGAAIGTVSQALAGSQMASLSLPVEPGPEAIERALAEAEVRLSASSSPSAGLVVGLYNPKTHPGQVALLTGLAPLAARYGRRLGFVLMRSPYDAEWLASMIRSVPSASLLEPSMLCSYEYSALSARSVAAFVLGLVRAEGRLPSGIHHRTV